MSVAEAKVGRVSVEAGGDREWSEAGSTTLAHLASLVRKRAKDISGDVDVDAVHDMRTATRRLRTAIGIFGDEADKDDRKAVERVLRRVARRLGAVRDLDVLLEALAASSQGRGAIDVDDIDPLRKAWHDEREAGAERLKDEIARPRLDNALDGAEQLVPTGRDGRGRPGGGGVVHRIADRAPALIWAAFGDVLAHDLDPLTADPAAIHEQRIDAKQLRYTLEAFEEALEPGAVLISQVTALQDAGGDMHDAIVGRDKARSTADALKLSDREQQAVDAFAELQDRRAEDLRPTIARCVSAVRGRPFRESLARALARMGHVSPVRR